MVPNCLSINCYTEYTFSRRESGRDSFGTEQLLKDYLDRYSRVVDERSDSKGMNNFKQTMDIVLAGKTLGKLADHANSNKSTLPVLTLRMLHL